MSNIKQTIAKNIKYFRHQKNINAIELAEVIGVSQSTISDWECAKKMPRAGAIDKLSSFFGVSKADIITDRDDTNWLSNDILDLEVLLDSPSRIVYGDKLLTVDDKILLAKLAQAVFGGKDIV